MLEQKYNGPLAFLREGQGEMSGECDLLSEVPLALFETERDEWLGQLTEDSNGKA